MEESGVGARGSYSAWLGFQGRLDVRAVDVTAETRGSGSCGACTDAEAGAGARGCSSMAAASGSDLLLGLGRRGRCLLGARGSWAARGWGGQPIWAEAKEGGIGSRPAGPRALVGPGHVLRVRELGWSGCWASRGRGKGGPTEGGQRGKGWSPREKYFPLLI